jgi:hypothetical protein
MQQKIFKVYLRHMKQSQVLTSLILVLMTLTPTVVVGQGKTPPQPSGRGPELGLPIDSNLYVLGIIGLALGAYVVLKKKPLSGKPE